MLMKSELNIKIHSMKSNIMFGSKENDVGSRLIDEVIK